MRRCELRNSSTSNKNVALLWDESFLWGLMAYKALKALNLSFDVMRAEDIRRGALDKYEMLFVPGGWATNKSKALGDTGRKAIQDFVADGGSYLGFCGGAGLAIEAKDGIGLLNVKRKPTKERVPSFSGRIKLDLTPHPIWNGLLKSAMQDAKVVNHSSLLTARLSSPKSPHSSLIFHAWWPSQFLIEDNSIRILATYGDALPDSFSSDLNVGDIGANGGWPELERFYQINLDPKRLMHEPAVVEGNYGKGKVILSLIHFDTPDDTNGQRILKNLWVYLAGENKEDRKLRRWEDEKSEPLNFSTSQSFSLEVVSELETTVNGLISLGERNFLWFWRNPMLLQWRRGVRGLEYNALYIMIKKISEILKRQNTLQIAGGQAEDPPNYRRAGRRPPKLLTGRQNTDKNLEQIKELLMPFVEKSGQLLILERYALQKGHITYERCDKPEIQRIRVELFSNSKCHGGMFKELINKVDNLLFSLMK